MQLAKRHFNAVQSALRKRSFEVKESQSWLDIHMELGVGEHSGSTLSLTREDHAVLRDWITREVGSDPITTDLTGDRLAMSVLARNEKWSDQDVFGGMVRVACTSGQISTSCGDITVPPGALMQIAVDEIDTRHLPGVVMVENGIIARHWHRCRVPPEIGAYLMVYRGHGADARACADWMKTLPPLVTKIGYFDLDPAGIGMAVDYKVDGVLVPRDLDDHLVDGAHSKPDEYDKQMNARPGLESEIPSGLEGLWSWMTASGRKCAVTQERMMSSDIELAVVPLNANL